jgi:hypothetical protein
MFRVKTSPANTVYFYTERLVYPVADATVMDEVFVFSAVVNGE